MSRQEKNPFSINAEYAQSRLILPFKDISAVWWRESEIHRHVPVFSIDSLLNKPDLYPLTLAGVGGHALVFRLTQQKNDMTVKISYPYPNTMKDYIYRMSSEDPSILLDLANEGIDLQLKYPASLPLRQIAGHMVGHQRYSQHIDPPLCVWVKKNRKQGHYVPVGYSIPFVKGTAIKIDEKPMAQKLAQRVEGNFGLYVGNKNDSENVIIEENGNIKFIDVEIRLRK